MKLCIVKSQLDEFRGLCQLFQDSVVLSLHRGWEEVMKSSRRYRKLEKAWSAHLNLLAVGHLKGFTVRGTAPSIQFVGFRIGGSVPRSGEPGEGPAGRTLQGACPAVDAVARGSSASREV